MYKEKLADQMLDIETVDMIKIERYMDKKGWSMGSIEKE